MPKTLSSQQAKPALSPWSKGGIGLGLGALALVVIGLLPQMDGLLAGAKLVLVWLLVLLSSAVVSQLIARSARRQDGQP